MADFGYAKYGDDEENEEEEEFDFQFRPALRDGLIFLVDCSKEMLDVEDNFSHFQLCMKCIMTTMQNKIISSDKDLIGVVFFGTEKHDNPGDHKHIYIYQSLEQPGADRILELEDMLEKGHKKFSDKYGHSTAFSLADALWTCQNMFANSPQKVNYKRIILFTDNDNPHAGDPQRQRQAKTKASDLNETGVELELMHLQRPSQLFDVTKFYKDLLYTADDEVTELPDPSERFDELMTRVRTKDHKKRATRRTTFKLGEGMSFSVGVYNLVRSCPRPSAVKLAKKTNADLKTHSKTYLKETGEILTPQDLKKAQTYGGRKIVFENDEVTEIRRFDEPGLHLMGFKPRSSVKNHYQVKPAQFIYPDESTISGSTTVFTALLAKCLERNVVPFCKYVPGKNQPPKFVALLPQDEELDDHRVQLTPPGFHVIFMPFADDFRKVKYETTPKAEPDQVDKAKELVKKLQFTFNSENFENPVLQNHWRNVEALALNRDELEELTDYSMPDVNTIDKKAGRVMEEFKDLVFPADYEPGAKKRGGASEGGAAKRAKTADVEEIDVEEEAKAGRLGKLTVAVLKELVKNEKISCSGTRKADLISAINKHYGVK